MIGEVLTKWALPAGASFMFAGVFLYMIHAIIRGNAGIAALFAALSLSQFVYVLLLIAGKRGWFDQ